MKAYLALISAAVIGLSACSQEASKPAEVSALTTSATSRATPAPVESTPPADAPAPEAASMATAPTAGNCATTVESSDNIQFDTKDIQVSKACKEFTITLKHTSIQPRPGMDRNIAIFKAEDMGGVLKDSAIAGTDTDYVKAGDARIVGHTKLIGGGREASVTVDPTRLADGSYKFYCSFLGHGALMSDTATLVDRVADNQAACLRAGCFLSI